MDKAGIRVAIEDDLIDTGLVHFGYVDYLRDFEMYFYFSSYDSTVRPHFILKYRFINCVVANTATTLSGETWKNSLDHSLIGSPEDVADPVDGWVWATRFGNMYPGGTLLEVSEEADRWSESVGVNFYEATFDASPIFVRLIFSDLVIERAIPGESPYTVERPLGA